MDVIAKIGYAENNYSGVIELPNEVIAVTNKTLNGIKKDLAETLDHSKQMYIKDNEPLPECLQGEYELKFELQISALLQSFDGILTRSAIARTTGINERQLGHYATGRSTPRPAQRKKIIKGIHEIGTKLINVV